MLHQRALPPNDKVLFRILKNKSPNGRSICEKLNNNVKNIVVLSEDELCELWQHMKGILLEAQKLCTQASKGDRYVKECNLMVKLIRTITAIAGETIVQRIFIPNVLLQNVMLLHSIVLPNINDKQQYVKRLYEIRSSIALLKCTEDVQQLLKLVREKTVMSLDEGRMLILHLFKLGEPYILGIYNNVKVVLQNVEDSHIAAYANLYVSAWSNATANVKKYIVENCLQNIILHCFRANRDSTGRERLGKNLLSFLAAIHENKNQAARSMIHNQCKILLWKHLKAPGSYIRCNAVEILFMTSSVQYTCGIKDRNTFYLKKFYKTVTDLLHDSDSQVCNVTMIGLLRLLEKHWNYIPNNIIRHWLSILLHYTETASSAEIRANVFIGLKKILIKERSHRILKDFLPNFAKSIYDEDQTVLEALIKLLWHAQNQLGIPFWDIVPLTYVLDRLQSTQDTFLLQELIKLVWQRISLNGSDNDQMREEIVYIGINNIQAIRRFCLHSKSVIDWNVSAQLIESILSTIKDELACMSLTNISKKNYNKRIKFSNKEDMEKTENANNWEHENLDSYRDIQICIDVIAMLLVANRRNIDDDNYNEEELKIIQLIANILPEFSSHFRETPVNDSVIFLFSLIPTKYFINNIEVIETLAQQLCSPDTSDNVLLSVLHVLMKWNKGQTILFALTNLFTESLSINTQNNQDSCNIATSVNINEKGLELSLRILKHLLHIEYQSDVFDASDHFAEILLWVKKTIVPHIPHVNIDTESRQICTDLIKCTLDTSNLLIKEYNCTPKLCCDIVLLYCSCLSPTGGVVFLNYAFDAILKLLDFSKMAFENHERNLLDIIVPNFVCVTMIDTLSALVIIHKMLKSSNKTLVNRLKNTTLAFKVHSQEQSYDTPFDKSIQNAITIAIDAILQK
ncbi:Condensin-2 complex subunit G2 [Dufourea novaeangliae]|uniref:Condensin-2 complex subunit G2 n=1 Tax=Dufourea novaeangliae TaxID=178035 RepID=A0A154P8Z9_DUFNO|nr:Condensin-2 complex subunit G2 [Dufourea novaeangliae]